MARKRGTKWQADAKYKGKRLRKSFDTEDAALAWERQVALSDTHGTPVPAGAHGPIIGDVFGPFWRSHFHYLWGGTKAPHAPQSNLELLERLIGEGTPLTALTSARLVTLVGELQALGNSNATVNRKMAALSKLLKHAKRVGALDVVPEIPRMRESEGRIRFITKAEEEQLLNYLMHVGLTESAHLTAFLLYTGARRSEAHNLEWRDVDMHKRRLTFWITKGGSARTIPITEKALEALRYWDARRKPGESRVVGLEYNTYTKHWERAREALGYAEDPQYIPHVLRHTCASRLVQNGIDLTRVQKWMGHKAIQTTLRYAHLAPDDLEVAASALGG